MPFAGSPLTATNPRTAPGWHRACGRTASVTAMAEPPSAKNNAAPARTVDGLTRIRATSVRVMVRASSPGGRMAVDEISSFVEWQGSVDDQIGARDRVVALDVAVLARHPCPDPRRPRGLAVAGETALEPSLVRRLDPHADVVVVAEHAVQRADALDDDDPAR